MAAQEPSHRVHRLDVSHRTAFTRSMGAEHADFDGHLTASTSESSRAYVALARSGRVDGFLRVNAFTAVTGLVDPATAVVVALLARGGARQELLTHLRQGSDSPFVQVVAAVAEEACSDFEVSGWNVFDAGTGLAWAEPGRNNAIRHFEPLAAVRPRCSGFIRGCARGRTRTAPTRAMKCPAGPGFGRRCRGRTCGSRNSSMGWPPAGLFEARPADASSAAHVRGNEGAS
jgi:hypothetical protein